MSYRSLSNERESLYYTLTFKFTFKFTVSTSRNRSDILSKLAKLQMLAIQRKVYQESESDSKNCTDDDDSGEMNSSDTIHVWKKC
jgi:hypothetical protein